MDKIKVNGKQFDCYGYNAFTENQIEKLHFVIADTDYPKVKELIGDINKVEIVDTSGATMVETSKFSTYESIYFYSKDMNVYHNDSGVSVDTFTITLKSRGLADRVEELAAMISPEFDESTMSIEDLKEYRKSLMSDACKDAIASTFTAETTYGDEQFQFGENEQELIRHMFVSAVTTGKSQSFHSSTDYASREYSAEDIIEIYTSFSNHEFSNLYRYDLLTAEIDSSSIREEIRAVNYDKELSEDQKSALEDAVTAHDLALAKLISTLQG